MLKRIRYECNLFFLALGFFSRIPMPPKVSYSPQLLNRSSRYYTLVGWLLGLLVAGVFWLSSLVFSPSISVWLAMAFSLLLTGVFHEDGLADTADGFGGAFAREKKLTIMKDSRIGSYGSAALIMVLLGKYLFLIESTDIITAILVAYPLSRAVSGTLIFDMHYVADTDTSKSKPLANQQSWRDCALLLLWCLPALLLVSWQVFGLLAIVLILARQLLKAFFNRQIGGYTGDCLGAAQQVCELVVYATLIAAITSLSV